MAAVYEDNFGYYDFESDPDEAAFFAFVKSQSKLRQCWRCREPVLLQPGRETCARCYEAMEYGAPTEWVAPNGAPRFKTPLSFPNKGR